MTPLPKGPTRATAAAYPMSPTVDANENPTVCHCCGRRAWSIGVGTANHKEKLTGDPRFLCGECILLIEQIRKVKRMDVFELKALDAGVDAVGEYIATHGITDLAFFDDLQQRMLVKAAWQGCADGLRKALNDEVPF